jgi:hypothetical protein
LAELPRVLANVVVTEFNYIGNYFFTWWMDPGIRLFCRFGPKYLFTDNYVLLETACLTAARAQFEALK